MGHDAGIRLGLALALSVALHLSLIFGVAVGPSVPASVHTIVARLVPEGATPKPADNVAGSRRPPASTATRTSGHESLKHERVELLGPPEPKTEPAAAARVDKSLLPRADIPLLVDPVWYVAKDLDVYPRPVMPVEPVYSESAADVSGEVSLLVKVDEFGAVQEITVVKAEPAGYFEDSASRAFKAARFSPAQRDGHPVRSQIVIKMRFGPQIQASAVR